MKLDKSKKKLVLIDVNALLHRAYHAFPATLSANGIQTNAIYGFSVLLLEIIEKFSPEYLVACIDVGKAENRLKIYKEYKATRKPIDQELLDQIPIAHEVINAFGIPIFSKKGYEADDLIGTVVNLKNIENRPDLDTIIVTGDKDIFQLVDHNTFVYLSGSSFSKSKLYGTKEVEEKMGFGPEKIIDYKALRGDPSDNIPGVKGIGEKGALDLLGQFDSLEEMLGNITKIESNRIRTALEKDIDNAKLSKVLATIDKKVDVDFDIEKTAFVGLQKSEVKDIFHKYNFRSLIRKIDQLNGDLMTKPVELKEARKMDKQLGFFEKAVETNRGEIFAKMEYNMLDTNSALDYLDNLSKQERFAFDTETDSLVERRTNLIGISFSYSSNSACFLPVGVIDKKVKKSLIELFGNPKIEKIGHNIKFDIHVLGGFGIKVVGELFDTMIAAFLLNGGTGRIGLKFLAKEYYQIETMEYGELMKSAVNKNDILTVPKKLLSDYACQDADLTWRLYLKYKEEFAKKDHRKVFELFETIEMPLINVLLSMEGSGIGLDTKYLKSLSAELKKRVDELERQVYEQAGVVFNLNSPRQLSEVLINKFGLSLSKKTKTGFYSTDEKVLYGLKDQHKVIRLILEYRELTKLRSTYAEALLGQIDEDTKRVHTSFSQSIARTGRLSSSNPNLQNIPISSEMGNKIRRAFVPEKGKIFVSFDYSQQELRILASVSRDEELVRSYREGVDVHTLTASKIFGCQMDAVTKEQRSVGKTVNFSVIYGISSFGLANRLEVDRSDAQDFIDKYFETYPGVKIYFDSILEDSRKMGYIETLYGRRRETSGLLSNNRIIRSRTEREVINFPLQGGAADMAKVAMIGVNDLISKKYKEYSLLLQIHDEVLLEMPYNQGGVEDILKNPEFQSFVNDIRDVMLRANKYDVPMKVDGGVGKNWADMTELTI